MRVTKNLTTTIKLLWSGEIVGLGVDEVTSHEVSDVHPDRELLVGRNSATVGRERKLRRRHVIDGRNGTDGRRVAGTALDLLAIGDGKVNGQAEVDEIVRRSEGSNLACRQPIISVQHQQDPVCISITYRQREGSDRRWRSPGQ